LKVTIQAERHFQTSYQSPFSSHSHERNHFLLSLLIFCFRSSLSAFAPHFLLSFYSFCFRFSYSFQFDRARDPPYLSVIGDLAAALGVLADDLQDFELLQDAVEAQKYHSIELSAGQAYVPMRTFLTIQVFMFTLI
jgi:hypothetical protein